MSQEQQPQRNRGPGGAGQSNRRKKTGLQQLNDQINSGEYQAAAEALFLLRISQPRTKLTEEQLKELGLGLVSIRSYEEAEAVLEEYLELHPENANWACIRLAAIQLQENRQPRACLQTLRQFNKSALTSDEMQMGKKLSQIAKQQIADGVQDKQADWE